MTFVRLCIPTLTARVTLPPYMIERIFRALLASTSRLRMCMPLADLPLGSAPPHINTPEPTLPVGPPRPRTLSSRASLHGSRQHGFQELLGRLRKRERRGRACWSRQCCLLCRYCPPKPCTCPCPTGTFTANISQVSRPTTQRQPQADVNTHRTTHINLHTHTFTHTHTHAGTHTRRHTHAQAHAGAH